MAENKSVGLGQSNTESKKTILSEKNKKLIFYTIMIAPLVLQVLVFYVYVNLSTFSLAFTEYSVVEGVGKGYVSKFVGFDNFVFMINDIFSPQNVGMIGVSFLMYAFVLFIATPVSIIFAFYVYKKFFLSEFFRIVLFFPQIISAVVMTTLYSYMVGDVYRQIFGSTVGLLDGDAGTAIITIIVYSLWMGFGGNVLLSSGAMSGINESVVESCHLDGCNTIKEFWYITLPSIWPTLITFVVIDISAIFTNQMNLYTFFGQSANTEFRSIGYYIYLNTLKGGLTSTQGWLNFSQLSAVGLMITAVILPLTLLVRHLMEKYGPSVN